MVDYSDFQTQMVRAFAFYTPPTMSFDGIGGIVFEHQIEPLEGIGGLSNNEVAELVYLETDATLDVFTGGGDTADGIPTYPVHVDLSGMVGINLTARQDFVRSSTANGKSTVVDEVQIPDGNDNVEVTEIRSPTVTDNDRLQMFEAFMTSNGDNAGVAAGSYTPFSAHKNFRSTHGRGPVLDQNDEISILGESSTNGADNDDVLDGIVFETEVRLTMYWDIAETSDAGRRFSVPRGL